MQLEAMRDYVRQRGWNTVVEAEDVEEEDAGSGTASRQKREELVAAARRGDLDVVVVWRLERWCCSLADLVTSLQEMVSLQVGFVSVSQAFELTPEGGRALAWVLAAVAEFEQERVKRKALRGPKGDSGTEKKRGHTGRQKRATKRLRNGL